MSKKIFKGLALATSIAISCTWVWADSASKAARKPASAPCTDLAALSSSAVKAINTDHKAGVKDRNFYDTATGDLKKDVTFIEANVFAGAYDEWTVHLNNTLSSDLFVVFVPHGLCTVENVPFAVHSEGS